MIRLTSIDQLDKLRDKNEKIVIGAFADWAKDSCDMLSMLEKQSRTGLAIVFAEIDIDESEELVSYLEIEELPICFFIKNSEIIEIYEDSGLDELESKIKLFAEDT